MLVRTPVCVSWPRIVSYSSNPLRQRMGASMRRVIIVALMVVMILCVPANILLAADSAGYTGKYIAERPKKAPSGSLDSTLEVVQNENAIEVTLLQSGKITVSRCPFDGSDGDYKSPSGISGKCKARWKEKNLIIESIIVTHPQPTASVRVHTKERWQLSKDGKTLTIKSDVDFPDFPAEVSGAVSGDTGGTTRYMRVENP